MKNKNNLLNRVETEGNGTVVQNTTPSLVVSSTSTQAGETTEGTTEEPETTETTEQQDTTEEIYSVGEGYEEDEDDEDDGDEEFEVEEEPTEDSVSGRQALIPKQKEQQIYKNVTSLALMQEKKEHRLISNALKTIFDQFTVYEETNARLEKDLAMYKRIVEDQSQIIKQLRSGIYGRSINKTEGTQNG